jgi:hypothetical protein
MIELVDTVPDINVQPAEYKRLLGYPRERVLSGRARQLAEMARTWYAANGRPWVYARQADGLKFDNGTIEIDGAAFNSKRVHHTLREAEADGVVLVAVSAGPEAEAGGRPCRVDPARYDVVLNRDDVVATGMLPPSGVGTRCSRLSIGGPAPARSANASDAPASVEPSVSPAETYRVQFARRRGFATRELRAWTPPFVGRATRRGRPSRPPLARRAARGGRSCDG